MASISKNCEFCERGRAVLLLLPVHPRSTKKLMITHIDRDPVYCQPAATCEDFQGLCHYRDSQEDDPRLEHIEEARSLIAAFVSAAAEAFERHKIWWRSWIWRHACLAVKSNARMASMRRLPAQLRSAALKHLSTESSAEISAQYLRQERHCQETYEPISCPSGSHSRHPLLK